jgi:hypothetical protein
MINFVNLAFYLKREAIFRNDTAKISSPGGAGVTSRALVSFKKHFFIILTINLRE